MVVEMVVQLARAHPDSKILVVAPSDSPADQITMQCVALRRSNRVPAGFALVEGGTAHMCIEPSLV